MSDPGEHGHDEHVERPEGKDVFTKYPGPVSWVITTIIGVIFVGGLWVTAPSGDHGHGDADHADPAPAEAAPADPAPADPAPDAEDAAGEDPAAE